MAPEMIAGEPYGTKVGYMTCTIVVNMCVPLQGKPKIPKKYLFIKFDSSVYVCVHVYHLFCLNTNADFSTSII